MSYDKGAGRGSNPMSPSILGLAKRASGQTPKSRKAKARPEEPRKIEFYPGCSLANQIVEADGGPEKHVKIEKYIDKMRYLQRRRERERDQ